MELEEKKEILKTLSLAKKNNGGIVYQLITNGYLDQLIAKITFSEVKFPFGIVSREHYLISKEQFIDALSELVSFFERSFPPLLRKEWYLSMLLEEKPPYFLANKNYQRDSKYLSTWIYCIKKYLVENMYDNICFIYNDFDNKRFFKGLDINDHLSLKNVKNVNKLYNFMQELIWCNYQDNALIYVFTNYKTMINDMNNDLTDQKTINLTVWNKYDDHWSRLIYNYNRHIDAVLNILK